MLSSEEIRTKALKILESLGTEPTQNIIVEIDEILRNTSPSDHRLTFLFTIRNIIAEKPYHPSDIVNLTKFDVYHQWIAKSAIHLIINNRNDAAELILKLSITHRPDTKLLYLQSLLLNKIKQNQKTIQRCLISNGNILDFSKYGSSEISKLATTQLLSSVLADLPQPVIKRSPSPSYQAKHVGLRAEKVSRAIAPEKLLDVKSRFLELVRDRPSLHSLVVYHSKRLLVYEGFKALVHLVSEIAHSDLRPILKNYFTDKCYLLLDGWIFRPLGPKQARPRRVPLHLDAAFMGTSPMSYNFWVPLDPVGRTAPSIEFVRGNLDSQELLQIYNDIEEANRHDPSYSIYHKFEGLLNEDKSIQTVAAALNPGDILIFDCLAPHRTQLLNATTSRIGMEMRFAGQDFIDAHADDDLGIGIPIDLSD